MGDNLVARGTCEDRQGDPVGAGKENTQTTTRQ